MIRRPSEALRTLFHTCLPHRLVLRYAFNQSHSARNLRRARVPKRRVSDGQPCGRFGRVFRNGFFWQEASRQCNRVLPRVASGRFEIEYCKRRRSGDSRRQHRQGCRTKRFWHRLYRSTRTAESNRVSVQVWICRSMDAPSTEREAGDVDSAPYLPLQ